MKTRKFLTIFAIVLLLAGQTLAACTVFAVGKDASADGSTLTSHTCDSNGDDFRLWLIPSMAEGTERDYVVNGRAGSDYSQFPEVKNYGSGIVFDTVANDKDTNQYLHSMYSFINDKGLAMGESTCGFDTSTEYGKKLRALFNDNEGLMDCYMIQDLALENCSTAREAVQYMGALIDEYGWNGYCEIMPICDGNETWVMEAYGAKVWIAVRVPDNMAFVGANRARIDVIDQSKYEYIMSANLYSFAKENGLWDGKSEFRPCQVYAPSASFGCTLREWRAIELMCPSLELDPYGDADEYPLFVVPEHKISVQDIFDMCSDYYAGTEFDCSRTLESGPFGNPLSIRNVYRPINMFRCTYVQIANIKGWLPEEARCLVWFGLGASDSTYLTPMFASATEIPAIYGEGKRLEPYTNDSAWWTCSHVQQVATINYIAAKPYIDAVRDPKMESVYKQTERAQRMAASMCVLGMNEEARDYLTNFAYYTAEDWHEQWIDLGNDLESTLMFGNVDMRGPKVSDWWKNLVKTTPLKPLEN